METVGNLSGVAGNGSRVSIDVADTLFTVADTCPLPKDKTMDNLTKTVIIRILIRSALVLAAGLSALRILMCVINR